MKTIIPKQNSVPDKTIISGKQEQPLIEENPTDIT